MSSQTAAFLSVLGAVLIWSTSFVAAKLALESFPPFTLAALRLAIATSVLGLIGVFSRQIRLPPRQDLGRMCLAGLVGIGLYFCFENYGLKFASSSDGVLLVSACPILTMILEWGLYRTHLSFKRVTGAIVAIIGVSLIIGNAEMVDGSQRLLGNLLLVCSSLTWAIYNFITRSVAEKYSMLTLNFFQSLSATLLFLPLTLLEQSEWVVPSRTSLEMLLYLALVCSIAAYLLYNYGLRSLDPSSAVSLLNFVPVFGVIFSVVVLKEEITWMQVFGGTVVLMGVSLSVKKRKAGNLTSLGRKPAKPL